MRKNEERRNFLAQGAAATAGLFAAGAVSGQEPTAPSQMKMNHADHESGGGFPRMKAGLGGPIGSPTDRGKLVPGYRDPNLPAVEVIAPDLQKMSGKMVRGAREFHLRATPARRELLPGIWMDAYGYNDLFPGPVLEMTQGERVRIVFRNDLPEETTLHPHGLELPVSMDGIPAVTQDYVKPGETFVYEFDVHQEGSYFLHPHVAMQEAVGMVVPFIIHPKVAHTPAVDRDFVLVAQQFSILPNATVPNSNAMDWNFLTLNGRSGPYTTPLVCKLGERVRIRFINFSTLHQHPMHLHGHTFWITGTEGGRIPDSAWIPSNNVVVGVAQSRDVEFIANNPGDWVLHCHMFHHMMNHMTSQVGPIIRQKENDPGFQVPGYPQIMKGMSSMKMEGMDGMKMDGMKTMPEGDNEYAMKMTMEDMKKITSRRETHGMRDGWYKGVKGLFSVLRVLPPELYDKLMNTGEPIPPNTSTPWDPHGKNMPMHEMHQS
ncbi:Copper resistance protein A precursor [Stieleria neptunia]|uniref:Copper resistance protein A n=2 Tax=Stieleria neptunia TaxID=2527979 RepID=A0A518I334_9BACT|nr:multicopper oxidase domain-containing protein [Phycisphaera sp. RhM]QDV47520.1 Copper resistance protein A precursor [Stieleria neptunia]